MIFKRKELQGDKSGESSGQGSSLYYNCTILTIAIEDEVVYCPGERIFSSPSRVAFSSIYCEIDLIKCNNTIL